jgi:hypothetical protein
MIKEVIVGDNSTYLKNTYPNRKAITSMEGWNTTWLSMPNIIPIKVYKY